MKIIAVTLLFQLLFTLNSIAQSALDKKNGFKDFTLGDHYTKWANDMDYIKRSNEKTIYKFKYPRNVFDYAIYNTELTFIESILTSIKITTEKFQYRDAVFMGTDDYNKIKSNLNILFGPETSSYMSENSGVVTSVWKGEKVSLTLNYHFLGTREGDRSSIVVESLSSVYDGF
jgi:hypothetical protein